MAPTNITYDAQGSYGLQVTAGVPTEEFDGIYLAEGDLNALSQPIVALRDTSAAPVTVTARLKSHLKSQTSCNKGI